MSFSSGRMDRRDFLKYVAAGMGALAFSPFYQQPEPKIEDREVLGGTGKVVRVAVKNVSIYKEPWDESQILYQRFRNDLMNVYYEVKSEYGPGYNPKWYRVWGGYVHSAHLQEVETHINEVDYSVNNTELPGKLAEVTVPFTQAYLNRTGSKWEEIFKLCYQSVYWVVGTAIGPDGYVWYRLKDAAYEYNTMDYYVPAEHLRIIQPAELTPITPDISIADKRIEVSIARQEMSCFEYDKVVKTLKVSTGIPSIKREGVIPTATPTGEFNIQNKVPSTHMGEGHITDDPEAYEIPGTPWVCYFEPKTGVAFHGAYWHNNFGMTMSHGCVNMPVNEAKWLFRWARPNIFEGMKRENTGLGTKVIVS